MSWSSDVLRKIDLPSLAPGLSVSVREGAPFSDPPTIEIGIPVTLPRCIRCKHLVCPHCEDFCDDADCIVHKGPCFEGLKCVYEGAFDERPFEVFSAVRRRVWNTIGALRVWTPSSGLWIVVEVVRGAEPLERDVIEFAASCHAATESTLNGSIAPTAAPSEPPAPENAF